MKVTVDRELLLGTLKSNLVQHETLYKEAKATAVEKYLKRAISRTERSLVKLKEGKSVQVEGHYFSNPDNHSNDYNMMIDLYSWEVADEVELTAEQFNNFVRDEWDWSKGWFVTHRGVEGPRGDTGPTGASGSIGSVGASRGYYDDDE